MQDMAAGKSNKVNSKPRALATIAEAHLFEFDI